MELRQYIKPLLRWWWLIVLSTGVAAVGSYIATIQQPRIYQTSTTLLVGQVIQKTEVTGQDFYITEQLAESYSQIAVRQPILQATVDSLGLKMSWQALRGQVYVQAVPRTQLLMISVSDTVPERATAVSDEIANQLILQSPRSPRNEARQERTAFIDTQLDDLESRIERAQSRVAELQTELATALSARQIQDLQTEISNLESLINEWQASYTELLNFLEGGEGPNYLTVIEPAQPAYVIGPKVKINVLLAAAVGFVLAVGATLLLEYIDDTLKSPDELSKALGSTTLGAVSRIEGKNYKDKLITVDDLFSPLAESYRMMRSNLQFMSLDQPAKSILITSANPNEGKSTTAANLAIIMAQADLKTIVVDADLRRPTMHKIFGVPNLGGLTELLRSPDLDIDSQLKQSGIENLSILTSGPLPPNPAEMMASKRMAQLSKSLEEMADIVIFDSPPVLPVTDAVALSNRVAGVIVVTLSGRTRRDATRQALQNLQRVNANILGGVLNGIPSRQRGDYNYQYNYPYTHSERGAQDPSFGSKTRWWQRLPFLNYKNYSAH